MKSLRYCPVCNDLLDVDGTCPNCEYPSNHHYPIFWRCTRCGKFNKHTKNCSKCFKKDAVTLSLVCASVFILLYFLLFPVNVAPPIGSVMNYSLSNNSLLISFNDDSFINSLSVSTINGSAFNITKTNQNYFVNTTNVSDDLIINFKAYNQKYSVKVHQ